MEVSRMSIHQETVASINKYYGTMTKKKKRSLRLEGIKKLGLSKESGHPFKLKELIYAAGYRLPEQYQTGYDFIKSCMKRGDVNIEHYNHDSKWYIFDDSNVVTKKIEVKQVDSEMKEVVTAAIELGKEIEKTTEEFSKMYNVHITIEKRHSEDFGAAKLVDFTINKTSLDIAKDVINQIFEVTE